MNEQTARDLAERAVEEAGGTRMVHGNPRHPFAAGQTLDVEIDGQRIEIRHGEISSPAIVTVDNWIFQILEDQIELLIRPKSGE